MHNINLHMVLHYYLEYMKYQKSQDSLLNHHFHKLMHQISTSHYYHMMYAKMERRYYCIRKNHKTHLLIYVYYLFLLKIQ